MKNFIFIGGFALAVGLAGCAVGPDYHRPAALPGQPLPKKFDGNNPAGTNGGWKIAEPSAHLPRGEWWQVFGDAKLSRLETLALTNNQNLAAAAERFLKNPALWPRERTQIFIRSSHWAARRTATSRASAPASTSQTRARPTARPRLTTHSPRRFIWAGKLTFGDACDGNRRPHMNVKPPRARMILNPRNWRRGR